MLPIPYSAIPDGWFALAHTRELPRGRILERRAFGRDLVVYRTASGEALVRDAHCPHLGAHLGTGRVDGDCIVCPFHSFAFDREGACVSTPYEGRPPARARLGTYATCEQYGVIFAFHHAAGGAPTFELPTLHGTGFTDFLFQSRTFRGHPQEISENSSDLGHFGPVHGYARARPLGDAVVAGHLLRAQYEVARKLDFIGLPGEATLTFTAEVHGLGYSFVHAEVPTLGIDVQLLVLPTPLDATTVELRMGARMRSPLPEPLRSLAHRFLLHAYMRDLAQDIPLWERKIFLERPALAEGEGPIATYRRYARQFYSTPRSVRTLPVVEDDARDAAE